MEAPPTACIVIVITVDLARVAIRGAFSLRACPDGANFARRLAVGMNPARRLLDFNITLDFLPN
jgi:hypothetical protein